jgi:hypothetical protein
VKQKSETELEAQSTPDKAPPKKLVQKKLYQNENEKAAY